MPVLPVLCWNTMTIETHLFRRSGLIALLAALLWGSTICDLQAASLSIEEGNPQGSIVLTAADCTLDQIMTELSQKYNFEVRGLEYTRTPELISATLHGSLESVLERLLRNWNHTMVISATNGAGVAKVTILNAQFGTARSDQVNAAQQAGAAATPSIGHF